MQQNPYQPPAETFPQTYPQPYAGYGSPYLYRPLGWRTMAATVTVGMAALSTVVGAVVMSSFHDDPSSVARAEPTDLMMIGLAAMFQVGAFILAAIFFCIWMHRAASNAWAFGAWPMTFTPGWSVGWFFVPCMNLVRPFQAMREVWIGSSSDGGIAPPTIGIWWGAFILARIISNVSSKFESSELDYVAALLTIGAAVACAMVMHGVNARQNATAASAAEAYPA